MSAENYGLINYLTFAYELAPEEYQAVISQLPKWATKERYDIQGRASGNPTKPVRLMMQDLLAERFKLALHYETRQLPVFALLLDKHGKLGPQFRLHAEDLACSITPTPNSAPPVTIPGGFPESCGAVLIMKPSVPGRYRDGARNVPMIRLTHLIANPVVLGGRHVIDKTGIAGNVDFVLEYTPDSAIAARLKLEPDPTGPSIFAALKEQLGLKLIPETGPVNVLVIDHVEPPSAN